MNAARYYRPVAGQLCQGDIFGRVPHLHLKTPPSPLKPATLAGKKPAYAVEEPAAGELPAPGQEVLVAATCLPARGMLLTYDCEIDSDKKHRTIALVRPLIGLPAESQDIIRQNRNFAYFYLPALDDRLPESYVDLRRLTTVHSQWIDDTPRLASLTEEARRALFLQFFRFFVRVELQAAIFGGPGA